MSKARDLADLMSTGGELADGQISASEISDLTATATEINVLDGIPAGLTATELGYLDGVTSNIQTQMDTKAPLASPSFSGTATFSTLNLGGVDVTGIGTDADDLVQLDASAKLPAVDGSQLTNIQGYSIATAMAMGNALS